MSCGAGQQLQLLAWELPYAAGAALKKEKRKSKGRRILGRRENTGKDLEIDTSLVLLGELKDFLYFKSVKYKMGCNKREASIYVLGISHRRAYTLS